MDKAAIIADIERRAIAVRIPIYKLCQSVGVAPATFTRWRRTDIVPNLTTIDKLETKLSELERARAA